jgi:beta-glucosidase
MIQGIMAAAPDIPSKTVLVLKDNAGVTLPDDASILGPAGPSILEVWFPGQEDGNIVGDLVFGVTNPSGKLPVTFPKSGQGFLDHIASDPASWPGVLIGDQPTVEYKEGLNIGYRWYDADASGQCTLDASRRNPCVAFPFGFGLSYTEFALSEPVISSDGQGISVEVTATLAIRMVKRSSRSTSVSPSRVSRRKNWSNLKRWPYPRGGRPA